MTTRKLAFFLVIAVNFAFSAKQNKPEKASGAPSIIGAWRVVSVETIRPNGEALTEWLGRRPTGMIIYLASGQMSVQIMRDPRPTIMGGGYETATPAEKVAMSEGYYAYCGTYEVDAQKGTVMHNVQASLRPNEVGTRKTRHFELVGNRLTLTTTPFDESGESRYNRLVWERIR